MRGRPRVLVLVWGLGIGGAEKLISEGVRHVDHERFDYHVGYVLPWKDQLVADVEACGVPALCLGGARGWLPVAVRNLRRLDEAVDFDLVHAHLPSAGLVARTAGVAPVVYTEHNLASSYRPWVRRLNRLTYAHNRAVLAVSGEVAASLVGYPGPVPRVVPNGVSVTVSQVEVARVRRELGLREGDRLVVHVGNIRPHKGHATLIEMAARLAQHLDLRMLSIGGEKYPGDLERVRAQAAAAGAPIEFLGRRSDAAAFIAAAEVLVNPSDVEGLPVVVLEAMAVGTPVVATAVGGVPSVIDDRSTGLLVPPKDPDALAEAVVRLLSDGRLAAEVVAAARKRVEAEHGLAAMVAAVEDVYGEVLGV